jgi:SAM-dependent methyltransferase
MAMITEEENSITQSVSQRYAKAVTNGEQMCCPTGYNHEDLGRFIPEAILKVSYGCGTPVGLSTVQPGEVVLDIGSGGGIDCFEASRKVGASGKVIGIDMTDEMLALARTHAPTVAKNLGYPVSNVDFRKGLADAIPVEDNQVDLIIATCTLLFPVWISCELCCCRYLESHCLVCSLEVHSYQVKESRPHTDIRSTAN